MPTWAWAGVAGGVLALGVAWRQARGPWLGPLFRYEVIKAARNPRQRRIRVGYVGLLLLGLLASYLSEFNGPNDPGLGFLVSGVVDPSRMARFAHQFLTIFLIVQALAVVVLTPAVVGGTICSEKDRGTFDQLKASPLFNRELVLGKLVAGLASVASVLFAGLPVLSLTMLFGGVDGPTLLAGFAIAAMTAASLGAFTVWLAVTRDGLGSVLGSAYFVVSMFTLFGFFLAWIPGLAALSPFSALTILMLDATMSGFLRRLTFWVTVGSTIGLHLLFAIGFARAAVLAVRRPAAWDARKPVVPKTPKPKPVTATTPTPLPMRPPPARRAYPIPRLRSDDDPLLWKERYFAGRVTLLKEGLAEGCGFFVATMAAMALGGWLWTGALGVIFGEWSPVNAVNPPVRVCGVSLLILAGLSAGIHAAGAIARERQRRSLDALFTLPLDRVDVLRAKALASAGKAIPWFLAMAGVAVVGLFTGGVDPAGLLAAILLGMGFVACCVGGGLWLSIRSASPVSAVTRGLAVLLVAWLLPLAIGPLVEAVGREFGVPGGGVVAEVCQWLSFPVGVWNSLFARADLSSSWWVPPLFGLAGALLHAVAGLLLWRAAARQFEEEGK